jgi:hypothetical protein
LILPDVNILAHAYREDSPDHGICRQAVESLVKSPAAFALSEFVLSGFVRVVTHPRIFDPPASRKQALEFCDFLTSQAHAVLLRPGPRHWELFARLCRESDARGNLVADAYHAALAIEHGARWLSMDRDFARFPDLDWFMP